MLKLLNHPITIVIVTLIASIFMLSLRRTNLKQAQSVITIQTTSEKIEQLENEVNLLENKLAEAETPLAKEKIFRNELLLQKPGEYVIQMHEEEIENLIDKTVKNPTPWEEWKKLLFDL